MSSTRRVVTIGPPLQAATGAAGELRFRHVGRLATLPQALLFGAIGAALLASPLPPLIGWVNVALAVFLLVGGLVNCLFATDLVLDPSRLRWRVARGLRFAPASAEGPLGDLSHLAVGLDPFEPQGGRWLALLYPLGSFRAYGLAQFEAPEAAVRFCEDLGRRCAIRVGEPVARESEVRRDARLQRIRDGAELARPPADRALRHTDDGFEIAYRELYARHTLNVDGKGVACAVSIGGRVAQGPRFSWKQITQIGLEPRWRGRWVLRPDWRERAQEWWAARCRELKRAPTPLPHRALPLAFLDDWLREPQRELVIRRYGHPIRFGDARVLGEDLMVWLEAALIREWGRHGGRNPP